MRLHTKLSATLFCAASVITLSSAAHAQEVESVVVTGSRVISDIQNSPTPLTLILAEQLQATTPTNIPDALNKLPVFSGSSSPTTSNTAGSNSSGNVLNLRGFGAQRTLILLDGHRAPPSNSNGTVNIDTLPQMLVSRVDVVTGGASAVYGSDAVTGVVNFILDKKFQGVKTNASVGISDYGDGESWQVGIAAGTSLFDGRGHISGSLRHQKVDGIEVNARSYGSPINWVITGPGTAASPYVNTSNARLNSFSFGGKITCGANCAANNQQFVGTGLIGPFNRGAPTNSASISIGGDGTYPTEVALASILRTDEAFGRFSYDLNDDTNAYVQVSAGEAFYYNNWTNNYIQTGSTTPNLFFKDNPFLTPSAQALLANTAGPAGFTNAFTMTRYFKDRNFITRALNRNLSLTAGINGVVFNDFAWDAYYTHGKTSSKVDSPTNQSAAKMYAASDAVIDTRAGSPTRGQIVCHISTTAFADRFPGCVPLNAFGPDSTTDEMYRYITLETGFTMTNTMDNVGGSLSGEIFTLPAGPVRAALSGEARWLTYEVDSYPKETSGFVDCTGLRLCRPETSNYLGSSSAAVAPVSQDVWEFAGEMGIPLLKDLPLVQNFDLTLAGRYTDYSNSGAVKTWKVGGDWRINGDIRLRGTESVDIRAPTLNDLYSPQQLGHGGFSDIHTGNTIQNVLNVSQGNAALTPEVARTYTVGTVLTPSFAPGFMMSVDYYKITLKNAIGSIGGNSAGVQQACEASNGTSPLCTLFVRPLPFSNRTPDNYPTAVLSQNLNAALNEIQGWDIEFNYRLALSNVAEALPGRVDLRVLVNNQPVNKTQQFAGAPVTVATAPKTRVTSFVAYNLDSWTFNLSHRWYSGFERSNSPGVVFFEVPRGDSHQYIDLNIKKEFKIERAEMEAYLSVQNVLNTEPNINPINSTVPGLYAAGYQPSGAGRIDGVDNIGRYFTLGLRARF